MLKQSITAVLLLFSFTTFLPHSVAAQSVQRFKINVPFSFVLNDKTLPPGRYVIERTDPGRPNIVTLRNAQGNSVRLALTQRVERAEPSTSASLVFIRREGKHYLFQIWNDGAMSGNEIPFAPDTETAGRQHTLVMLRARR